ncbi:Rab3 GTPase-activating protein catalytic subunit [Thecamonas trahens ATCC 50062]|uniref:Rab3 GTPase-activating protein catalytic subunit n=1 Tax=Thecamonas trahens ATCC 50062 TaxID=461836 RepID=A0A0L0DRY4_THETB|nr:Rab3 GTPase-activating protein catalytic subunit [Thecamonas trahens ATCC 50062]KNC55059.1 Rab3 GTPase-activating protein catalytic subunit [Thecamonas trahens ATCC 50062]|eukprot:XP_013753363.1 Rab3 GTPase-activating protein catalytic subunit [Thecamonas trahens ATCC 50062]
MSAPADAVAAADDLGGGDDLAMGSLATQGMRQSLEVETGTDDMIDTADSADDSGGAASPMAASGDVGDEPFEIVDFTTVSPFEKLVAKLEALLREWGLFGFSELSDALTTASGAVEYKGKMLTLSVVFGSPPGSLPVPPPEAEHFPRAMIGYMDPSDDFAYRVPDITRWFGTKDFAVLEPDDAVKDYAFAAELLSALTVAMDYAACTLPHFVPVDGSAKSAYIGYMAHGSAVLRMESSAVATVPPAAQHLDGLLAAFGALFAQRHLPPNVPRPPRPPGAAGDDASAPLVSIQYTFVRGPEWVAWRAKRAVAPGAAVPGRCGWGDGAPSLQLWGPGTDPLLGVYLFTTWPQFPHDTFVDSERYSDLQPRAAPMWTLRLERARESDGGLTAALHGALLTFRDAQTVLTLAELLPPPPPAIAAARRTPKPLINRIVAMAGASSSQLVSPSTVPSQIELGSLMRTLFQHRPNVAPQSPDPPLPPPLEALCGTGTFKAAPRGSLVADLAGAVLDYGVKGVAMVWEAFAAELRRAWEADEPLPGMPRLPALPSFCRHDVFSTPQAAAAAARGHVQVSLFPPNLHIETRASVLAQKTEMVAIAILTRKFYAHLADTAGIEYEVPVEYSVEGNASAAALDAGARDSADSDGDGFFDASDTPMPAVRRGALWPMEPRRELLHAAPGSGDAAIYVPLAPVHNFMTEDLMEELEELLFQLGTSPKAADQRAEMQSASLYADMCGFKAANPGAVVEDFVRWHSPRDFDEESRSLSVRFAGDAGDNLWLRLWDKAQPAPMWEQEPLFDCEKQAEHALAFLEHLSPALLVQLLLPCLWARAAEALFADARLAQLSYVSAAATTFAAVVKKCRKLFRKLDAVNAQAFEARAAYTANSGGSRSMRPGLMARAAELNAQGAVLEAQALAFLAAFSQLEADVALAASLLYKMGDADGMAALLDDVLVAEVGLVPTALRDPVLAVFEDNGAKAVAATREFIIRQRKALPWEGGLALGQRMYVALSGDAFRVATVQAHAE